MAEKLSRRRFLRAALFGAGAAGLVGCAESGPDAAEIARRTRDYDAELDCRDVGGLFPAEVRTRTDNEYVDRSADPLQYCFLCSNFEKPANPGRCASCRTVKGPIHPLGWCSAWTEMRT